MHGAKRRLPPNSVLCTNLTANLPLWGTWGGTGTTVLVRSSDPTGVCRAMESVKPVVVLVVVVVVVALAACKQLTRRLIAQSVRIL